MALEKLGTDQVKVRILSSGVGAISERTSRRPAPRTPLLSASTCAPFHRPVILPSAMVSKLAIIRLYELIDEEGGDGGLLSPDTQEDFIGYAEIRQVFGVRRLARLPVAM